MDEPLPDGGFEDDAAPLWDADAGADAGAAPPLAPAAGAPPDEEDEPAEEWMNDAEVGAGPSGPPPTRFVLAEELASGRALTGAALRGVPSRLDLIRADPAAAESHQGWLRKINEGKMVLFFPNDVQETITYRRAGGWNSPATQHYRLNIFGVLPDGSKAVVTVDDAPVYFDVWVPEPGGVPLDPAAFSYQLSVLLQEYGLSRTETGEAYPLRGFREKPRQYLRLHFPCLAQRKKAIEAVRGQGHQTASDDRSNYFRMLARVYGIPLCGWIVLSSYEYEAGGANPWGGAEIVLGPAAGVRTQAERAGQPPSRQLAHVFRVPTDSLRPLQHPLEANPAVEKRVSENPELARDRTLVMTFDIETHSRDKGTGQPPNATRPDDVVFMLCATAHWRSDPQPLARVCLTTQTCAPDARWATVLCGTGGTAAGNNPTYGQDSLLMAFALLFEKWAPDIVTGFNDGQYDWPFLVEKARQLRLLALMEQHMSAAPRRTNTDENILRWQYATEQPIKISAEKRHFVSFLKFPGWVPVDVRVSYMRLYPKAEKTSLKWFLNEVGLGGKADMPYSLMWRYYERAAGLADEGYSDPETERDAAENMRRVAHYCIVDAQRCQELLTRRNVVAERREEGNYSFTSFYDTVYYAGGHKVCNMLLAYGQRSAALLGVPVLGSMIASKTEMTGKYPGAYVVPPVKGLEEDDPITGLDFASLYPSLIRTYNLSLDRFVGSEEEARRLEARGYQIHRDSFEFGGRTVHVRFVKHCEEDAQRGIFARVLADLFDKRAAMKVDLKKYEAQIESFEAALGDFGRAGGGFRQFLSEREREHRAAAAAADGKERKSLTARADEFAAVLEAAGSSGDAETHCAFQATLADVEFKYTALNSKQKAVKVFMNTFYGEAGNQNSPIFLLELAGGVTSAGQYNLKLVAEFVAGRGFRIRYGDTDSLYLACPAEVYAEAEARYREALAALGVSAPPDAAEQLAAAQAAWDAEESQIRAGYADKVEKFRGLEAALAAAADAPLGTAAYAAAHPEYHARYETAVRKIQEIRTAADAALRALGPRPTAVPAPDASRWLQHVFDGRPDVEEPVRAAYEELCKEKVTITMQVMAELRDEVNAHLEQDNGGKILKMAYEEVLFPSVWTGKKKYFGIAHVYGPNFHISGPDKIFVRGIDVVKQGQTRLTREIGYQCMWEATRLHPPGARRTLLERVEAVLRDTCGGAHSFRANDVAGSGRWTLDDFVQTDAWKPQKDNKSVQKFMRRMRARHRLQLAENEQRAARGEPPLELDYVEPEPGERFAYLIVDAGPSFDLRGYTRGAPSKGDLMEYVHVARKENLPINVPYYLIHYVVGLCARFICYEDRFQLAPATVGTGAGQRTLPVDPKAADEHAQKRAKAYLTTFIRDLTKERKGDATKLGHAYRRSYRDAVRQMLSRIGEMFDESVAGLLTGSGERAFVLDRELRNLDPVARAGEGVLSFELLLPPEPDETAEDGEEGAAAPPLEDRLLLAAANFGDHLVRWSEEPVAVDGPAEGLAARTARIMGFAGGPADPARRAYLYATIRALSPPSWRETARLRAWSFGAPLFPHGCYEALRAERERAAHAGLRRLAPALESAGEQVQTMLESLVLAARAAGAGTSAVADVGDALRGLELDEREQAALREAQDHWLTLVGIRFERGAAARLLAHLTALRDRAL